MIGRSIGSYQVLAKLGEGGMGEVYRARDTRLGRDVAIKILPPAFTSDADRLARFEREARVLASLNHPNIATIYGVEQVDEILALVMELVEGDTLAERIAKGAIPIASALPLARQIADAIDAAHEKGIVHRDLKPANIKITRDGAVKVLDFGLAKALVQDSASATAGDAATMTIGDTREGVIVGTAAYMSPEQARGEAVDKRTDIWAFGCVLYEMLTGRAAFARNTISDTLAAVLEREPALDALPAATPTNVRRVLDRCFVKDQKRRLRDIGDARADLEDSPPTSAMAPGVATSAQRRSRSIRALAAGALGVTLVGGLAYVAGLRIGQDAVDAQPYQFVPLAAEPADETYPSWSPDGRSIVYVTEVGSVRQLFTRALDSFVSTQITKSSKDCLMPFWSHDGARIYYISQDPRSQDLVAVGATGGDPQVVVTDAAAAAISPDGQTLAFLRGPLGRRTLWIASTTNAAEAKQYQTPPFPETFGFSTSLAFSRDGSQLAVLVRRQQGLAYTGELWLLPQPSGAPRRVLEGIPDPANSRVSWSSDNRHIVWDSGFAGRTGVHLYVADTQRSTFHQITSGIVSEQSPAVSPDGDRIAFTAGSDDVDLISVPLDGSRIQMLLASASSEMSPAWSPNALQFVYVSNARGASEIWLRSVQEGWARPIIARDSDRQDATRVLARPSFSPDSQRIVYEVWGRNHAIAVAFVADGRGIFLDQESIDQHSPAWSPDGKWIAYQRMNGQRWELVKISSGGGMPMRLGEATPGGGLHTAWSPTGDWIAHVVGGALRLTSASGRQTERTIEGPQPSVFGFSLDGTLLYVVRRASTGWSLVTVAVESGREIKSTSLDIPATATVSGFSMHPDGRSFATSIGIPRHDIWLLNGFNRPL